MNTRTVSLVVVLGVLAAGVGGAQQGAMTMKELLRADLSAPGHEVVQSYIVIPPGAASGGKHTHPGEEIAFVIEGSLRVEIDGEAAVVKNAGESIIVPAGRMHFASNAGSGSVRAVSTWVVEKGKPRTTMVQ